jgi:hypothetical protein
MAPVHSTKIVRFFCAVHDTCPNHLNGKILCNARHLFIPTKGKLLMYNAWNLYIYHLQQIITMYQIYPVKCIPLKDQASPIAPVYTIKRETFPCAILIHANCTCYLNGKLKCNALYMFIPTIG